MRKFFVHPTRFTSWTADQSTFAAFMQQKYIKVSYVITDCIIKFRRVANCYCEMCNVLLYAFNRRDARITLYIQDIPILEVKTIEEFKHI